MSKKLKKQEKKHQIYKYPDVLKEVDKWSDRDIYDKVKEYQEYCYDKGRCLFISKFYEYHNIIIYLVKERIRNKQTKKEDKEVIDKIIYINKIVEEAATENIIEKSLQKKYSGSFSEFYLINRFPNWSSTSTSQNSQLKDISINIKYFSTDAGRDSREENKRKKVESKEIIDTIESMEVVNKELTAPPVNELPIIDIIPTVSINDTLDSMLGDSNE